MKYLFLFLLLIPAVFAHQPQMVDGPFTVVKEPEISKAYYGELSGDPHIYMFSIDHPFRLYTSLLVPDMEDSEFDFSVVIIRSNDNFEEIVAAKHGLDGVWDFFYEPFAKDAYWVLDVFGEDHGGIYMAPGIYQILVFSPDNKGKYVLAVGDIESFPFSQILASWFEFPEVKMFMGKNPLSAYTNMAGGPFVVFLLLILYLAYRTAVR